MVRTFDMSRWWIWVINGVVTIGCFVAFILIDGKEIVFAQYIPLDLFLTVCKTVFYFYYYHRDKQEKINEKRIKDRLIKKQTKLMNGDDNQKNLKISLLNKDNLEFSDNTSNDSMFSQQ